MPSTVVSTADSTAKNSELVLAWSDSGKRHRATALGVLLVKESEPASFDCTNHDAVQFNDMATFGRWMRGSAGCWWRTTRRTTRDDGRRTSWGPRPRTMGRYSSGPSS